MADVVKEEAEDRDVELEEVVVQDPEKQEFLSEDHTAAPQKNYTRVIMFVLLGLATFSVSSAAAVMIKLQDAPPLLRASWRLQILTVLLLPLFLYDLYKTEKTLRQRCFERRSLLLLLASGTALALHFAFWIASLDWTSLPHSLLFVTSMPILSVVIRAVASIKLLNLMRPPTITETIAAILGFIGMAITLIDIKTDKKVTLYGDLSALLGALLVWAHLEAGKIIRNYMPLFIYTFPVTLIATVTLIMGSLLIEGSNIYDVINWLDYKYIYYVLYLGIIPGLFGHTILNNVVKILDPIIISIFLLMEPVIGSVIGYILNVSPIPDKWTWVGGIIITLSLLCVLLSESDKVLSYKNIIIEYIRKYIPRRNKI